MNEQSELQFLLMEQIKSTIDKQIADSGIDNDVLLENAREQAWESYKEYFLKGVNVESEKNKFNKV